MTPKPTATARFRLAHKISAWYDAEAYFRRRARGAGVFGMPIPGLGEVSFAAKSAQVREFLKVPASAFTPPKPNPIEPVVGEGSIILLDGTSHKLERARFLPALHGDRIKRYGAVMAQAASDETATWHPGARIDARDAAQSITLRIIVSAVFGIDEEARCADFVTVVKAMMRDYVAPFMFFPALRRAPLGLGPWRRFSKRRAELDAMLSDQITRRRRADRDDYEDVLSALMSDGVAERSDADILQQLRTLLVSGHETSATTLAWALFHIHADDDVRRRLLAELEDVRAIEELPKLPYLGAVIAETLRMHPTVSIVVRQLNYPVALWNSERTAGDVVGVALPALHADPAVWPDPGRFDPQRFLTRRPSPAEYSPFGYGHRRCPGSAFAALELAVALGTILTSVELRLPERRARLPRSIPRGVAAVPSRPIFLEVVRKLERTVGDR